MSEPNPTDVDGASSRSLAQRGEDAGLREDAGSLTEVDGGCEPGTPAFSPWRDRSRWLLLLVVATVWVILDQVTKAWAHGTLQHMPGRVMHLVDGFFALSYVRNPGAAWGFLASADGSFRLPFFITVTSVAMVFMLYIFVRLEPGQWLLMLALSSILGGALGNFIDRVRFNYVIDFILMHVQMRWRWPTFNVADVAISVGVALMLGEMIFGPMLARRAGGAEADPQPRPEPEQEG